MTEADLLRLADLIADGDRFERVFGQGSLSFEFQALLKVGDGLAGNPATRGALQRP